MPVEQYNLELVEEQRDKLLEENLKLRKLIAALVGDWGDADMVYSGWLSPEDAFAVVDASHELRQKDGLNKDSTMTPERELQEIDTYLTFIGRPEKYYDEGKIQTLNRVICALPRLTEKGQVHAAQA
jgi:hypothetical protein